MGKSSAKYDDAVYAVGRRVLGPFSGPSLLFRPCSGVPPLQVTPSHPNMIGRLLLATDCQISIVVQPEQEARHNVFRGSESRCLAK